MFVATRYATEIRSSSNFDPLTNMRYISGWLEKFNKVGCHKRLKTKGVRGVKDTKVSAIKVFHNRVGRER